MPGAHAQYWQPLRNGIPNAIGDVRVVYGDTVWDRLLTGSPAKWIIEWPDTLVIVGIAQWDGERWDTLPSRIQSAQGSVQNGCAAINRLFRYQGDLYANGDFSFITPQGVVNWDFGRWNETESQWEALECTSPFMNGVSQIPMVPPQDTLYFTGYYGSICSYPQSCVFAYDGSGFHPFPPFDAFPYYHGNYVGYVFRYLGQLYMTGLLTDTAAGAFYGFLRYNGTGWEPVPGFATYAPIKDVLIHDGKLYVCGYFFTDTGAPGNLVTMYDGQQWSDMGGGLRYALPNSTSGNAFDLHEHNGDIYVGGQFNYAGGVPAQNVARWNGHQWCGMGGQYGPPGSQVFSLTHWRDTLYAAGGFASIDGQVFNHLAKWLGTTENCSPSVGIVEPEDTMTGVTPTLLAENGVWHLPLPNRARVLHLYDSQGRLVRTERLSGQERAVVDLSSLSCGVYSAVCITADGMLTSARLFK